MYTIFWWKSHNMLQLKLPQESQSQRKNEMFAECERGEMRWWKCLLLFFMVAATFHMFIFPQPHVHLQKSLFSRISVSNIIYWLVLVHQLFFYWIRSSRVESAEMERMLCVEFTCYVFQLSFDYSIAVFCKILRLFLERMKFQRKKENSS
jgi:hypothetical protein